MAYTGAPDRMIKMEEKNDYIAVSVTYLTLQACKAAIDALTV